MRTYYIASEKTQASLEVFVDKMLKNENWKLVGGVSFDPNTNEYIQALILEEKR